MQPLYLMIWFFRYNYNTYSRVQNLCWVKRRVFCTYFSAFYQKSQAIQQINGLQFIWIAEGWQFIKMAFLYFIFYKVEVSINFYINSYHSCE